MPDRLALLAFCLLPVAASAASAERIVEQTFLPSQRNVQGEFRLIERGDDTWCAQTVLDTSSLRRALRKIRNLEKGRWTVAAAPRDSSAYLEALEAAGNWVLERAKAPNGRHQLVIEVESSPDRGAFSIFSARLERDLESYSIVDKRAITHGDVEAGYARSTVLLQSSEAFGEAPALDGLADRDGRGGRR